MILQRNILELNLCIAASLMHYQATAFSKNGKKTIERLDGSSAALGNTVGLYQVTNYRARIFCRRTVRRKKMLVLVRLGN